MNRANSNIKERKTFEWTRGIISNIGTTSTLPYDILYHRIREKNLYEIIDLFFQNSTKIVDYLDQCILEQFWWINTNIVSARYSKITHPTHYSGEYIFDKKNGERTILEIRQPDLDGKHWKARHMHIKRGQIDKEDNHRIIKPTFNEHIELSGGVINGVYIMKIF